MNTRRAAVVVATALSLAACSSSGGGSSSSSHAANTAPASTASSSTATTAAANSAFCSSLAQVGTQVSQLTAKASDPAGLKALLGTEGAYLARLKSQAPAELQSVFADLGTLLTQARQALANPQKPDVTKLQALATRLPADETKLEAYAKTHCASS